MIQLDLWFCVLLQATYLGPFPFPAVSPDAPLKGPHLAEFLQEGLMGEELNILQEVDGLFVSGSTANFVLMLWVARVDALEDAETAKATQGEL